MFIYGKIQAKRNSAEWERYGNGRGEIELERKKKHNIVKDERMKEKKCIEVVLIKLLENFS